MRAMPPKTDLLSRGFQWVNDRKVERDIFRLRTNKLSQRNGPICCIRVVMVSARALLVPKDKMMTNHISLFRNKRFALNEMFQRNASKFALFYV